LNKRFAQLSSMAHAEAGDVIAKRQIDLLRVFAGVCAIVVALIVFGFALLGFVFRQHAKAIRIARKDELTGIDNRFALNQKLFSIKASRSRAILLLDVDHFKDINDTLGHLLGDQFLLALSKRLAAVTSEASLFARLGGDEFAILFEGAFAVVQVQTCADAILQSLREPLVIDGHLLRASVSMGMAVLGPDDDQNDVTLMKNADLALYAAKADGRACFRLFDPAMDRALQRRQQLLNGLSQAIAAGELFLVFQPIVTLEDQRIAGFEALLRWRHPEMGLVSPAEFIPVAEESGLILDIGRWVIDEACRVAALWPERVVVSVNISGRQFADSHLYDCIEEALTRHRISPPRLMVELTESILIEHDEDVWDVLLRLRKLGVVISLDDFGTGYASLGYLRRFAFDRLKIDQSFVRSSESDPSSLAIVSAICSLAKSLGLKIVAEGIETQDHCDLVRAAGCHYGQGYLFDRPLSAEAATWRVSPGRGLTAAIAATARLALAEPEASPLRRQVA
jgi:diguanylate cyclase (GGDEF)-like protein